MATLGVARDWRVDAGIEHLRKFTAFDEVAVGRSWANHAIQEYLYGDLPGLGATPQVIVVARTFDNLKGHVSVTRERVVARVTGLDEIAAWATSGAPYSAGSLSGPSELPVKR